MFVKKECEIRKEKFIYMMTPTLLMVIAIKFLSNISYISALKIGEASVIIPIVTANVLLVEILSSIFLKEKIKPYQYIFMGVFFVAILMLVI